MSWAVSQKCATHHCQDNGRHNERLIQKPQVQSVENPEVPALLVQLLAKAQFAAAHEALQAHKT